MEYFAKSQGLLEINEIHNLKLQNERLTERISVLERKVAFYKEDAKLARIPVTELRRYINHLQSELKAKETFIVQMGEDIQSLAKNPAKNHYESLRAIKIYINNVLNEQ
ncbi:MAG: hypothetical protein ACI4XL_00035 [Bacillus sp. (in: firmicutes)]